jgi:hypothetical protein
MCMGGGGGAPTPPPMPTPPKRPETPKPPERKSFQQASGGGKANRQSDKQIAAYQSGRQKTIITGARGDTSAATLSDKVILGA